MRVRKLSTTGDYVFGNSQKDFYRDVPEAVGQVVKTSLLLWLGEWYLDITAGTPYLQGVLGKHSKELADATIQTQTLGVQVIGPDGTTVSGVTGIRNYESVLDPNTRALSTELSIDTIYGPTIVQIENYKNF